MTEVNYKNQLQEYLQSNYRPLPRYETSGHDRAWKAVVYLETLKFESEACIQKKDAEKAAAKKALEYIARAKTSQQQQRGGFQQQPPGTSQDRTDDDLADLMSPLALSTAKNELQEHFQKRNMMVPYYEQRQHGSTGLWWSTVTFIYAEKSLQIRSQKQWPQKVDADKDAAVQALKFLREHPDVKPKYKKPERPVGVILVDLESIPQVKLGSCVFPPEWWVVGFHSKLCTWPEAEHLDSKMQLEKINDGHKDSADHLMTYWAAKEVATCPEIRRAVIATRDHYGGALEVLMSADGKSVKHVASVDDIMWALRNL